MNGDRFGPGDRLLTKLRIECQHEPFNAERWVLLEMGGEFFYYPSWGINPDQVVIRMPDSAIRIERIIDVTLPDHMESSGPIVLFAGPLYRHTWNVIDPESAAFELQG